MKVTAGYDEFKTHRLILDRLKTALARQEFGLVVIFPTLSLLEAVQEELLADPEVPGYGGFRLLLFEGFIQELGQELGVGRPKPGPLEQELLLYECFKRLDAAGKINYLNRVPCNSGYRQAILQGFAEWKRSGLTPERFRNWATGRGPRVEQLALLYDLYQQALVERGFGDEYLILEELEKRSGSPGNGEPQDTVVLYGFSDLTPIQMRFIQALASRFRFEALVDPTLVAEFQDLIAKHFPFTIHTPSGFIEPDSALKKLQRRFWAGPPVPEAIEPGDRSLQIWQAAGATGLATGIAREIRDCLRAHPDWGLRDFLILTPVPQAFIQTARPVFQEYGLTLPETAIPIQQSPMVARFLEALRVVNADWQWNEIAVLVRRSYPKRLNAVVDRLLLEIADRYGAVSGRRRWLNLIRQEAFRQYFCELGLDLEPLTAILHKTATIPDSATLREYLTFCRDWLSTPQIPLEPDDPLFVREIQDRRAVRELVRLIEVWIRFLDSAVPELSVVREATLRCSEFQRQFEDFLIRAELEPLSSARAELRVLPLREARGLLARVVFIVGLEQGVLPRFYVNDWKLTPAERLDFRSRGVELETGVQYQIQERLAFYWALQTAVQSLYLVYQNQDDNGQPLVRSAFLEEIVDYFPGLEQRRRILPLVPKAPGEWNDCYTAYEKRSFWVERLNAPVREIMSNEANAPNLFDAVDQVNIVAQNASGVINGFSETAPWIEPSCRILEAEILDWQDRCGFQPVFFRDQESYERLRRVFGSGYVWSITALEDFRDCPYRFFLKHALKVKPLLEPELFPTGLELGNLYHQILQDFCEHYRGMSLVAEKAAEYRQVLADCFESFYREWQESAPNDLLKLVLFIQEKQIRRALNLWLDSEIHWAEATNHRFRIFGLEYAFGLAKGDYDAGSLPEPYQLETDDGPIRIWGKIDRVDRDEAGYFNVYDYKSGRGPSTQDILNIKRLQLAVYLLALEQLSFGQDRALGGSYIGLRQPSRSRGGVWRAQRIALPFGGKAALADETWEKWLHGVEAALVETVTAIRDAEFGSLGADCPDYCEYRDICRRSEREGGWADGAEQGTK